jgi:hypothetical protein
VSPTTAPAARSTANGNGGSDRADGLVAAVRRPDADGTGRGGSVVRGRGVLDVHDIDTMRTT